HEPRRSDGTAHQPHAKNQNQRRVSYGDEFELTWECGVSAPLWIERFGTPMKIILAAVENSLAEAWQQFCGDLEFVTVHRGSILELNVVAVVSPENSFGFMDVGLDVRYPSHLGGELQTRLKDA